MNIRTQVYWRFIKQTYIVSIDIIQSIHYKELEGMLLCNIWLGVGAYLEESNNSNFLFLNKFFGSLYSVKCLGRWTSLFLQPGNNLTLGTATCMTNTEFRTSFLLIYNSVVIVHHSYFMFFCPDVPVSKIR